MIKIVSLLSKALVTTLAIMTAFGAGWVSCSLWVIMGLRKDTGTNYARPRYKSYKDYYEREDRAV